MEIDASIVLDDLVHQFADPMAFFRELIQNAIDAGTGDIDVSVDFESSDQDPERGRMTVEIRDYGVGMDRQVIQNELLKLFNSGKDRDLTKIGRFGIGFVSVFAVGPDAVCVDTGRAGESWRVLFDADRTYELFERDVPIEGTSVRLFDQVGRPEFERFEQRAREVIFEWCKHVETPIYFNGDEISAPFDIDSVCKCTLETEGTRIVAGYVRQQGAAFGYYHSGLTLKEGTGGPWRNVSFKLDSRYLEHTLTRDQVIEDKNFRKAVEMLEALVFEELPAKLVQDLEQAVSAGRIDDAEELARLAIIRPRSSNWLREQKTLPGRRGQQSPLFPMTDGRALSVRELASCQKLFWNRTITLVVDNLPEDVHVISSPRGEIAALASLVLERDVPSIDDTMVYLERRTPASPAEEALAGALTALLTRETAIDLQFGVFHGPQTHTERPWIAADSAGPIHPVEQLPPTALDSTRRAAHLTLNQRNPLIKKLLGTAGQRPDWSALMLLLLTCPDATGDVPGADQLLRRAYDRAMEAT